MRLRTVGRRTGEERTAILGHFEDGPDLVTMAMNGWADPDERPRLRARWAAPGGDLDAYAARRSRDTAGVILEPRPAP